MTSNFRNFFMVGLASIVAIALLIFGIAFLGGKVSAGKTIHATILFKDAGGLFEGGEVRMAGVRVGTISEVGLNGEKQAVVKVRLDKKYPVPGDSEFQVQGSILGNTALLSIIPGKPTSPPLKDGDVRIGTQQADLQSVLGQSQNLIPTLQKTAESAQRTMLAIEKLTSDPSKQRELNRTLANIEAITTNLNRATANLPGVANTAQSQLIALSTQSRRLLNDLDAAAVSGNRIAKNGEKISSNLNDTLQENRKTIHSLLESADESASALTGLLNQAGGLINDPDIKRNLVQTTANLADVTSRLQATTGNIEQLTSDPRLAADLRETVSNLKETSASIRNLTARVETVRIPGERRQPDPNATPAPKKPAAATSLVEPGLAFDSLYDTTNPRFRADVGYTYRTGRQGRFYRAGLYDLTEENGLNLQIGQELGKGGNVDMAYRLGLVNGKFGLGLDSKLGPMDFRLEGYDPNRFTGNARLKLYLNRDRTQSLLFGLDDITRENRATIGVQFRQ